MQNLATLFENDHFIAVDKPMGWLSIPSRQGKADDRPCAGIFLEKKLRTQIWPVHRLDEPVSGILLFAKNAEAHAVANGWFEASQVLKSYEALSLAECLPNTEIKTSQPLEQPPLNTDLEWQSQLCKGKRRTFEAPHGKKALTMARCLAKIDTAKRPLYLWQLQPKTGRNHQLRFELSKRGYPILGDALYGSKEKFIDQGIALRAVQLSFKNCKESGTFGLPEFLNVNGIQNLLTTSEASKK